MIFNVYMHDDVFFNAAYPDSCTRVGSHIHFVQIAGESCCDRWRVRFLVGLYYKKSMFGWQDEPYTEMGVKNTLPEAIGTDGRSIWHPFKYYGSPCQNKHRFPIIIYNIISKLWQ